MQSGTGPSWSGATTCQRQLDVASFLLGALTLPEERELMTHVAACRTCQAALHELGTLPDLLALVPRSVVELINRSPDPFQLGASLRPRKDTVVLTPKSPVTVEVIADNPDQWGCAAATSTTPRPGW